MVCVKLCWGRQDAGGEKYYHKCYSSEQALMGVLGGWRRGVGGQCGCG